MSEQEAMLGLASTEELIVELAARSSVAVAVGERWPFYNTVMSEEEQKSERGMFGMPGLGAGNIHHIAGEDTFSVSTQDYYAHAMRLKGAPATDQARRILNMILPDVMSHFIQRNAEYGEEAHVLGVQGQYADINRKVIKLKRYIWDGVEVPPGAESVNMIAGELIGHLLILLDELYSEDALEPLEDFDE